MSNWRPILPVPDGVKIVIPHHPLGQPSASWPYNNAEGRLLTIMCRFNHTAKDGTPILDQDGKPKKEFYPLTYCENETTGARAWRWQALPAPRPLYNLDKLATSPDAPVLICEGEKSADAAALLFSDFVVATSPNGSQAAQAADWSPLAGRRVVIWPDHDDPGRKYAAAVSRLALAASAAEVRVVVVPDCFPPKWDLADTPPEGWNAVRLRSLLDAAEPVSATSGGNEKSLAANKAPPDWKTEVARLSTLSPIEYDRARPEAVRRLGCRPASLDAEVKAARMAARSVNALAPGRGHALNLPETDPWPEPVDGAEVLGEFAKVLISYVDVTEQQAHAIILWVAFTYAHDVLCISPILLLTSPQKRCGKTQVMKIIILTARKGKFTSGMSAAALLRAMDQGGVTILLDEFDSLMKQGDEMRETVRGLLNSSFEKAGAIYSKCVPLPDGGWENRDFSTWVPVAAAAIGTAPDTVGDRSIEVKMKRKSRLNRKRRLRSNDGGDLREIGRKLARWIGDNITSLRDAEPEIPEALNDRAADAWDSLIAIADLAGGDWPQRARTAALALSGDGAVDDENIGSMLLADMKQIFGALPTEQEHMPSSDLANALADMKDRPWADWRNGKPITPNGLAKLLKPYGIRPENIRIGGKVPKGYKLHSFTDACERYLSPEAPAAPSSNRYAATNAENKGSNSHSQPLHPEPCSGCENTEKSNSGATCSGVADQNPRDGGEAERDWRLDPRWAYLQEPLEGLDA